MDNYKLKAILTGRITVGIVCLVLGFTLGAVIFSNKSGVNISQDRYDQLIAAEKKADEENTKKETSSKKDKDKKKEEEEIAVHGKGETITVTDSKDNKMTALTIDSVKLIDKRNSYSDKKANKVVSIEYTYENIGYEKKIAIYDGRFKVYDASGNELETYPAGVDKDPQPTSQGKKCTANMSFALNNSSNELEIEYYEKMIDMKPSAKFKVVAE
jgi:lipopolysaccharide export LptBFGC system permease protein LptF